jgi:hypothetical protein
MVRIEKPDYPIFFKMTFKNILNNKTRSIYAKTVPNIIGPI